MATYREVLQSVALESLPGEQPQEVTELSRHGITRNTFGARLAVAVVTDTRAVTFEFLNRDYPPDTDTAELPVIGRLLGVSTVRSTPAGWIYPASEYERPSGLSAHPEPDDVGLQFVSGMIAVGKPLEVVAVRRQASDDTTGAPDFSIINGETVHAITVARTGGFPFVTDKK